MSAATAIDKGPVRSPRCGPAGPSRFTGNLRTGYNNPRRAAQAAKGSSGFPYGRKGGREVQTLLLATRNPGKVREYEQLLRGVPFQLSSLAQLGIDVVAEETGHSFEENACIKARTYAVASGLLTLADDSGLEVDALAGAPGVRSARYGGVDASDEDRVALLLEALKDVAWEGRVARFRCAIAIGWPSGELQTVTGVVEGVIQREARGAGGFGYDPVFYLPHLGRTMAELDPEKKNQLSHRAQATKKAVAILESVYKNGTRER